MSLQKYINELIRIYNQESEKLRNGWYQGGERTASANLEVLKGTIHTLDKISVAEMMTTPTTLHEKNS